nr:hypothetical protein CFP56_03820 [Quercus suber]
MVNCTPSLSRFWAMVCLSEYEAHSLYDTSCKGVSEKNRDTAVELNDIATPLASTQPRTCLWMASYGFLLH